MALMLREKEPRPYTYVCTPTGDELPEMVVHFNRLDVLLGEPLIRLTNGTLASVIRDNKMLPNCHARFCTRILKLKPYGRFMVEAAPSVSYIGLRADEEDREGTRPGGDYAGVNTKVVQDFPLRRGGVNLEGVWKFLAEKNITIPERTDCARCPYQMLGEWYNLWQNHPTIYSDAEADETRLGHTFRSPQRDTWPASLRELRLLFEVGKIPERSIHMMEKRRGMCRACSL